MRIALVVGGVLAASVLLYAALIPIAIRFHIRPLLWVVRQVNRRVFNPVQLRDAGSPGASAGIVEHIGRTSGRTYRTPVGIEGTEDQIVVVLPYGPDADWVRNVLAAGGATIHHDGRHIPVTTPRVVPMSDVLDKLDPSDHRSLRLFGITQALTLAPASTAP